MKATTCWGIWTAAAILALASPLVAQEGLRWESDLQTAQNLARQTNRLVLIHFGGPWCGPCRMLEQKVFSQPGFGGELAANYVAVKVDPNVERGIARNYGIERVPTDVVATPSGQLIYRIASPSTAADYVSVMSRIAAQARPDREQARPPHVDPAAPPAPQVAVDSRYGSQAPSRPAGDRYAEHYNQRPSVEREPYQPPVQNQAPPTTEQAQAPASAQPPAQQPPGQSPPGDRYADRYADRNSASAPTAMQDREPQSQPPQPTIEASYQASAKPDDRYGARGASPMGMNPAEQQASAQPPAAPAATNQEPPLETRIPAGSPPLALDGFCPVTLQEQHHWQVGDPKWGAIHRGMLYLFVSQAEQQKFLANPDHFSPVLRGHDPVLALDQNKAVPGRREYGVFCDGRIYLFSSEATRDHFERNSKRYSADILQAMR